jgi:hypothetical protein
VERQDKILLLERRDNVHKATRKLHFQISVIQAPVGGLNSGYIQLWIADDSHKAQKMTLDWREDAICSSPMQKNHYDMLHSLHFIPMCSQLLVSTIINLFMLWDNVSEQFSMFYNSNCLSEKQTGICLPKRKEKRIDVVAWEHMRWKLQHS